jgi:two-component system cell cycle response regulator
MRSAPIVDGADLAVIGAMQQNPSETFWAPVLALEAAAEALKSGQAEAADSIRRIAGRIAETARSTGMDRAATAAGVLQTANARELDSVVDSVLDFLRTEMRRVPETKERVLIVEDDRVTATVMKDTLECPEWDVVVATTGREALQIIEQGDISVILLDLVLPDLDGRDILLKLRNATATAWTPVIVLTAKDDALTQSECYALGADGFLVKPIDWEVLRSAVSSKLQRVGALHREAHLDALTMLPNRAAFWDAFAKSLSQRAGTALSVAMIDLDRFKSVNDTYGHETGDEVLRIVARVLTNSLRGRDFLARWGGEEFCVFMPHTPQRAAVRVLNNALQRIRQTTITATDGRQFTTTFSCGVATVSAGIGGGDALAQADRHLYVAKNAGRNRIISDAESDEPPKPRVLLADDDKNVCMTVKLTLEREGFEVVSYPDGASALMAAANLDFAMAIIDVGMPIMDGFELVKHMRALPKCAATPIVMLTGAGSQADIVKGFQLGVSDYIVKPFQRGEFVARIWRLLRTR